MDIPSQFLLVSQFTHDNVLIAHNDTETVLVSSLPEPVI